MGDRYINPQLQSIEIEHEYEKEGDPTYWAKLLAIYLENTLLREGLLKRKPQQIGEVFYLVTCSERFKQRPEQHWLDEDFDKALIMQEYSHDDAMEYVNRHVGAIGRVTIDQFDERMRKVFDMSDWDNVDGSTGD